MGLDMAGFYPKPETCSTKALKDDEWGKNRLNCAGGFDCSADRRDHEHRAASANRFIVETDPDNRICTHAPRPVLDFVEGRLPGFFEDVLVSTRAPADIVCDRRHDVPEEIGARYGLTRDDAEIFGDGMTLQGVGCRNDHFYPQLR